MRECSMYCSAASHLCYLQKQVLHLKVWHQALIHRPDEAPKGRCWSTLLQINREFGTPEEIPRRLPGSQLLCWQAEYNCASPGRLPSLEAVWRDLIFADAAVTPVWHRRLMHTSTAPSCITHKRKELTAMLQAALPWSKLHQYCNLFQYFIYILNLFKLYSETVLSTPKPRQQTI